MQGSHFTSWHLLNQEIVRATIVGTAVAVVNGRSGRASPELASRASTATFDNPKVSKPPDSLDLVATDTVHIYYKENKTSALIVVEEIMRLDSRKFALVILISVLPALGGCCLMVACNRCYEQECEPRRS